ncbi:alpha/beta-hydrolase [Laetiporus sulphureus 93-53]|uniref:Alpha/beta-hydrolase n=1 Tax=Laetiporus sulphureus 93-53 TaxID=1314785 RepID=A0A165IG39_9APHY|nr:alpha/beta-hydrolase [Laetiporus sulphureus 93-53]KZT13024.1 alpha/beta-hydrolase [Laetiporus sulphureus 93-53]
MGVNTFSAVAHITPVVVKTLLKHGRQKGHKLKHGDETEEATDDIFYDEAFHIVKAFIELGTHNTVESLQAFTNTHVPSPPWAAVSPVQVPLASCNKAADVLIEWFGPDDLKHVVGGERWWQVRGSDGIDSEWITERKYLDHAQISRPERLTETEEHILRMEHLKTVMLYVHGGAYFWGSINTHRYQVIRYARKMKGRAFAVNYRKAPQYPWPCALQDVLAAYFYLIDPPAGALHQAVSPSKIVFAGDSSGAGLCLTVLTVLRDMGLPQPAGAVLISPWVDMTHSFPSVMTNAATDIIPPHGFIHKPSVTWPIHALPTDGRARAIETQTNPPPKPGHADTLRPSDTRFETQMECLQQMREKGEEVHAGDLKEGKEKLGSQQEMLHSFGTSTSGRCRSDDNLSGEDTPFPIQDNLATPHSQVKATYGPTLENGDEQPEDVNAGSDKQDHEDAQGSSKRFPAAANDNGGEHRNREWNDDAVIDFWEPKPPKVFMDDPNATPLELRSQIQLYATNEQLTHPLVSPVLQGSLGNLCPLYIIAGDGEVLRDEIMYIAHKAAHPEEYPVRRGILRESRRQRENAEKFQTPTRVHLQVFDGMCHVLTVFTFTDSAKYAYASIAQFVKHVATQPADHLERNPFPELHIPPEELSDTDSEDDHNRERPPTKHTVDSGEKVLKEAIPSARSGAEHFKHNEEKAKEEVKRGEVDQMPPGSENGVVDNGAGKDIPRVIMIRERVGVSGKVRSMEPVEEIEVLRIPPELIGIIKEAPVKRWLTGQELWDKKYKHAAHKAIMRRRKYERKAERLLQHAREQGTLHRLESRPGPLHRRRSHISACSAASGEIDPDRRWGPFDLVDEKPPPSAIPGRRDTHDAIALLKKNIYHTAPATHLMVPTITTFDAIRAAFDREDHPSRPPQQSVSEQQIYLHGIPIHGVRIWQSLITYFMRKSSRKASKTAAHGKKRAATLINEATNKLSFARSESSPDSPAQG